MSINDEVKEGEIVLISSGEYSNYGISGVFTALKSFDPKTAANDFMKEIGRLGKEYDWEVDDKNQEKFVVWLSANNFIKDLDYSEIHTGGYGQLEIT